MSKTSKRAITILITGMFLLSIIPMTFAAIGIDNDAPVAGTRYNVGDTIVVEGTGVTSGATINLYWDYVTTAGLMNNTQGSPAGNFEVWMDVPDTPAGEHWIWVKDMETSLSESVRVVVDPEVDLSATSGLVDEELDVDGTGYMDDDDISVYFGTSPVRLHERYGDSTADWSTDPIGTEDVVRLVGDATSNANARVLISGGPTLLAFDETAAGLSIYYTKSVAAGLSPEIELIFSDPNCVNPYDADSANRAHVEITIPTTTTPTTAWQPASIVAGTVWWFGNDVDGTPFSGTSADWATAVTDIDNAVAANNADTWVLTGAGPQVGWGVVGTYYVDDVKVEGTTYNLTSPDDTATSDDDGTWITTFDIPDLPDDTTYTVSAVGSGDFWDTHDFTIGAVITLDIDEGPTGSIVNIEGRGFTASSTLDTVMIDGVPMLTVEDTVGEVTVSGGEFEAEFVVPDVAEGEYTITVEDLGTKSAYADFEVNGEPEIEVEPTYGSPGAIITIIGSNFTKIDGTEVTVVLLGDTLVTAETDSDGAFEDTFVSPAVPFITYTVTATDEYSIDATDAFKVGMIALIINPVYGEAGTEIAITGIGFENGVYNLTFGDELYEDYDTVSSEAISDTFFIPNVEPGAYDLVIIDTAENELTVQFTVTESTTASMDPALAPNLYNITLSGNNFADVAAAVDFVIYNSTDEWDMDVRTITGAVNAPTETDSDGNFTGFWYVLDEDTLSLGDYTINITDSQDLMMQLSFSVVAARVQVTPRKALFDRGNTITFDISNDFDLPDSYIEIFSPNDILYWITDDFTDGTLGPDMWVLLDNLYTVPYYRQTANQNPMELQSDAPLGTWTYFFYDNADDELMNSTFEVGPSTAAQVDALLEDVRSDLSELADDLAGVTDEIEDDIGALADDISDVASEVDNLRDDIVADLADDIAAAADAAKSAADAVSDLADTVGDIADVASDAKSSADDAANAATDAKTAAEDSQQTAQGLTTLVYGAIAASLIAALAAVVSLMQISKKIA